MYICTYTIQKSVQSLYRKDSSLVCIAVRLNQLLHESGLPKDTVNKNCQSHRFALKSLSQEHVAIVYTTELFI